MSNPEFIIVPHPAERWGKAIRVPQTGSDSPLTDDAKLMLALADEVDRLKAECSALKANDARWRFYAASPQTAAMLGSKLDPNGDVDWVAECNKLADDIIAHYHD